MVLNKEMHIKGLLKSMKHNSARPELEEDESYVLSKYPPHFDY